MNFTTKVHAGLLTCFEVQGNCFSQEGWVYGGWSGHWILSEVSGFTLSNLDLPCAGTRRSMTAVTRCNMPHWLACPIDTCQSGMGLPVCPIDTGHWGMGLPACPNGMCQWGTGLLTRARAPLTHVIWNTCQWGTLHRSSAGRCPFGVHPSPIAVRVKTEPKKLWRWVGVEGAQPWPN